MGSYFHKTRFILKASSELCENKIFLLATDKYLSMKKYLFIFFFSVITTELFSQITLNEKFISYMGSQVSTVQYNGDVATVFSGKDNTEGNRYLFDKPASGKIFTTDSTLLNTEGFVFNYDKMSKKLIAVKDGKTIIDVNTDHIKSFVLTNEVETNNFVRVPAINQGFFIQLVKDKRYSLYKTIQTKFQPADYFNNGIIERGNNFDSYVDIFEYYVVFPNGEYKKIELKRKSIKTIFIGEGKKVKKYYKICVDEVGGFVPVNEKFLKGLTTYFNQ